MPQPDDTHAAPAGALRAALREARESFPVWFGAWMGLGHVYTATWLVSARINTFATLLLPLSFVVAFYVARQRRGQLPPVGALVMLTASAPLVAAVWWLPAWLMHDAADPTRLKLAFEILALLWVSSLIWHCRLTRGWRGVAVFFGIGAVYGFFLENGGIVLGYFSEPEYRIYVPFSNTPLSSVAGWCTIFYPAVFIAESIVEGWANTRRTAAALVLIVTGNALATDLHFDPVATALRMWVWHPSLPPVWLNVPLVNFTSWFTSVLAFAIAYRVARRRGWLERSLPVFAAVAIPVMLTFAAVANLILIGALEGFSGPSWTIFRAALGR